VHAGVWSTRFRPLVMDAHGHRHPGRLSAKAAMRTVEHKRFHSVEKRGRPMLHRGGLLQHRSLLSAVNASAPRIGLPYVCAAEAISFA